MTRDQLQELEEKLMKLRVRIGSLGGYDTHAENEIVFSDAILRIVQHLLEKTPRSKKTDD